MTVSTELHTISKILVVKLVSPSSQAGRMAWHIGELTARHGTDRVEVGKPTPISCSDFNMHEMTCASQPHKYA